MRVIKKTICALVAVRTLGLSLLAADDIFVGTWKMNEAKTKATNMPEAKGMTLVITQEGNTVTMTLKGILGGQPFSEKFTTPYAGGTVTYIEGADASPAGLVSVAKPIDDYTVDTTTTLNGKQISLQHVVVSKDQKTMTVKESGTNEKGKPYKFVAIYERQ